MPGSRLEHNRAPHHFTLFLAIACVKEGKFKTHHTNNKDYVGQNDRPNFIPTNNKVNALVGSSYTPVLNKLLFLIVTVSLSLDWNTSCKCRAAIFIGKSQDFARRMPIIFCARIFTRHRHFTWHFTRQSTFYLA